MTLGSPRRPRARIIVPAIDDGTEGPDAVVCRGERIDVVEVGGHGGCGVAVVTVAAFEHCID